MRLTLFKETETSEVAEKQSFQRMTVAVLYGLVRKDPLRRVRE